MTAAFFAQFAAGTFLVVALAATRACGWPYFRLMAIVSTTLGVVAAALLWRDTIRNPAICSSIGAVFGIAWLFVNAAQRDGISPLQRLFAFAAGAACMAASLLLCPADAFAYATTILCAGMLGSVTAAMLLGHRYLTDTQMAIAPLVRLTQVYLAILALRVIEAGIAGSRLASDSFHANGDPNWFWLIVITRVAVGLIAVGIFAWMAWDCVRRRATQSATAMYYLSMVLVFIGELAGQYLTRTQSLAM